jgi:hypothetical protein
MTQAAQPNDDMPAEIDFSGSVRGKFHRPGMALQKPVYLDSAVQSRLSKLAHAKGIDLTDLVNSLLKKDIELIEMAS